MREPRRFPRSRVSKPARRPTSRVRPSDNSRDWMRRHRRRAPHAPPTRRPDAPATNARHPLPAAAEPRPGPPRPAARASPRAAHAPKRPPLARCPIEAPWHFRRAPQILTVLHPSLRRPGPRARRPPSFALVGIGPPTPRRPSRVSRECKTVKICSRSRKTGGSPLQPRPSRPPRATNRRPTRVSPLHPAGAAR